MNCIYKLFRLSLLLLFGMAAITEAAAQRYVADQLFKDSIFVHEVKIAKGDTVILDDYLTIPNGERLVDDGCPAFVKCGSSYLAKNHGAHRIMRPDGTFVIGPAKESGEEGWKPWNDVFGMPQRDGYIFARREIDDEDYYGYVLPNGQFRILFDQSVVYAGTPSW